MFDDEELITIERYINPLEAEMAKSRLDSAGIPNFLVGENTALLYGTGLGGLQLQVRPRDEEDARVILSDSLSGRDRSGESGADPESEERD